MRGKSYIFLEAHENTSNHANIQKQCLKVFHMLQYMLGMTILLLVYSRNVMKGRSKEFLKISDNPSNYANINRICFRISLMCCGMLLQRLTCFTHLEKLLSIHERQIVIVSRSTQRGFKLC